jgi:hypothetical protein
VAQEGIRDYLEGAAILNRRSFLSLLAGSAAASTTAYFLSPIGGWHSDVIVNPYDLPLASRQHAALDRAALDRAMRVLNEYFEATKHRSFEV